MTVDGIDATVTAIYATVTEINATVDGSDAAVDDIVPWIHVTTCFCKALRLRGGNGAVQKAREVKIKCLERLFGEAATREIGELLVHT